MFLFCVFFFFYRGSTQERLSYEFYNKTERLGIGLVKIEKQLITVKNQGLSKHIEEDMYNPKHIVPLFFKPDYNIFYVVCLERQKAYYKVLSATGDIYCIQSRSQICVLGSVSKQYYGSNQPKLGAKSAARDAF